MKYRSEIDGLRSLAVVPVVLFHADIALFQGGFVGVDIFFVISGYLITTILIDDLERDDFSILRFYERRARRILPALFFVMLLCIPFAWMWMIPRQFTDFSQSLIAVSVFASNILFWRESGYFDAAAEEKPLLHTWSLAVEEQYYVIFPIFLLLFWRFGKDRVFWMIAGVAAISLLLSEWGWRNDASANFYLAHTRAWELLAGSIAAFILSKRDVQKNEALAALGLAGILFAIFVYDKSTPFPSVYALVPVVGVTLVILYAQAGTMVARLLSLKPLVAIGLISYSVYLWHQPLFAFARLRLIEEPSTLLFIGLSVLSLVLGWFSWKFIEQPFRNKSTISRNAIFAFSIAGITTFAGLGVGGHVFSRELGAIWIAQQTPEFQRVFTMLGTDDPSARNWRGQEGGRHDLGECIFNVRSLDTEIATRLRSCAASHGSGTLILGDSHAIDLFGVLASRQDNAFLVGITQGGCRPHDNHNDCHYDAVTEFVAQNTGVFDLVVYEQAGFYLLQDSAGTKGARRIFTKFKMSDPVEGVSINPENVRLTSEYLADLSQHVAVKWFLPRVEPHIPMDFVLKNGCTHEYLLREGHFEVFTALDEFIERSTAAAFAGTFTTVNQNQLFGFTFPADFMTCDALYWNDGDHFSAAGEVHFGQRIPEGFLTP